MVSTFTPNKNIEQPAHNDAVNTWDVPVNADWSQIDKAFGNSTLKNATGLSGNVTLAVADYVPLTLIISGAPAAAVTYVVPSGVGGQWVFANATTGGFNIGIKSNAGGTTINVPAGQNTLVSCDGSATGMRLSITTPPPAAGSTTQVQYNNVGVLSGNPNLLFDGTTLFPANLNVGGNSSLGLNAGSVLTLVGTGLTTTTNLNVNAGQFFLNQTTGRIGIGTITPASRLTVAGVVESTSGGFKFPDGTVQTTAIGLGHVTAVTGTFNNTVSTQNIISGFTLQNGNSGGWLNLSTGRYTPPAGRYFIMCNASIQAPVSGNGTATIGVRKNGVALAPVIFGSGAALFSIPLTMGLYVDANGTDFFEFSMNPGAAGMSAQGNCSFTAFPI